MIKLYDTKLHKKVDFVPLEDGRVSMYVCGPTVYNYIHIGNARTFISFDVIRRYLMWRGYDVTFVQNVTDVDDKIINKANEEGRSAAEVAAEYTEAFIEDMHTAGVLDPDIRPKATEEIPSMIELVQQLIDGGHAYEAEGDVYFAVRSYEGYGALSGRNIDEMEGGHRELRADGQGLEDRKRDPLDFALWKAAKPGEPAWESPWGMGRPGWHIECSAMAKHYLGDTIDIHCGGQDLIFPHHENEIAQSECANGCAFAHYWMHNGYINIDNRKMSKSLGNFFTVREVAEQFGYEPIRFMMIAAHYRSPINYSVEVINQSISALERLYNCRDELDFALSQAGAEGSDALQKAADEAKEKFVAALSDDLNTADGIAALFDLCKEINLRLNGEEPQQKAALEHAAKIFDELAGVLGLLYNRKKNEVTPEIQELVDRRQAARKAKDFAEADALRDQLAAMGVTLKDTPEGVQITVK